MTTKEEAEVHTNPTALLGSEIKEVVQQETPANTAAKKSYPKEKHPKATQSPKFGQRLSVSPPKEEAPPKQVKSLERKRSDTKPEVLKPATPFERKISDTKVATSLKPSDRKRSDTKVEGITPQKRAPEPPVKVYT